MEVDRIETQSYATDAALLAELRATWPTIAGAARGDSGYLLADLASREPVAAVRLANRLAIGLVPDGDAFLVVPLVVSVADSGVARWRRAVPGDGLSAFVAGAPMASERPIGVDQTNESVVVGERAIVKWHRRVGPGSSRSLPLLAHLDAAGFHGIPTPLGAVTWHPPAGAELAIAQGDAYLPGARDGWEWCLERAARHVAHGRALCPSTCDPWIGGRLGNLVAELHEALRTPSAVIPEPVADATPANLARWTTSAAATLDEAQELTEGQDGAALRAMAPAIREVLASVPATDATAIQPVHGDLHVGQVLEWDGGLAVIDFDGNPTLPPEANALRQPAARDVAQLSVSLDLVGRVVDERTGGRERALVEAWIAANRRDFLEAVDGDASLHQAFEAEQLCRELVYAARFLPRWRYAPMAALRARFSAARSP